MQTTSIDQDAGLINLTTVLAHASGEWIASDWPVCAVSETATPHRMGAALTYARRYALFTLVGIAGEDDLDAPDLPTQLSSTEAPRNGRSRRNGGRKNSRQNIPADRKVNSANVILKSQLSAVLRDQLLSELKDVDLVDAAAIWARRILPAKNSLNIADARQLENAFQARLAELELGVGNTEPPPSPLGSIRNHATALERKRPERTETSTTERVEKNRPAHPEPRRVRDREHVKFVAGHPCLICGRRPADPHHLRFAQSRALGRKVSDKFTVPRRPRAPPRSSSMWRRSSMVGKARRDRSAWGGKCSVARDTPARVKWPTRKSRCCPTPGERASVAIVMSHSSGTGFGCGSAADRNHSHLDHSPARRPQSAASIPLLGKGRPPKRPPRLARS